MKLFLEFNDNEYLHLSNLEEDHTFEMQWDGMTVFFRRLEKKEGVAALLKGAILSHRFNSEYGLPFEITIDSLKANTPIFAYTDPATLQDQSRGKY